MLIESNVADIPTLISRVQAEMANIVGGVMPNLGNDPVWWQNVFQSEPIVCQPNLIWKLKDGSVVKLPMFGMRGIIVTEIEEVFHVNGAEMCDVVVHITNVSYTHQTTPSEKTEWLPTRVQRGVLSFAAAKRDGPPQYHLGRMADVVAHGIETSPPHITGLPLLVDTRVLAVDPSIKVYIDAKTGTIRHSGERVFLFPRDPKTGSTVNVGENLDLPVLSVSPDEAILLLPDMLLPHDADNSWMPTYDDSPSANMIFENRGAVIDLDDGADFYGNGMIIGWDSRQKKYTLRGFSERFDGNPYDKGSLKGVVPFDIEQQAEIKRWLNGSMFPDEKLNPFTHMPSLLSTEDAYSLAKSKTDFDDIFISSDHIEAACKHMSELGGGAVCIDLVQSHFYGYLFSYDDNRMHRLRPNDEKASVILKSLYG